MTWSLKDDETAYHLMYWNADTLQIQAIRRRPQNGILFLSTIPSIENIPSSI